MMSEIPEKLRFVGVVTKTKGLSIGSLVIGFVFGLLLALTICS